MSCDKLPRVKKEDGQGHLDYWWKRHNTVVELLHEREDMIRYACTFIHQNETGHTVVKNKKRWSCEDCSLDLRVMNLDDMLLVSQFPYHYPGDKDDCG